MTDITSIANFVSPIFFGMFVCYVWTAMTDMSIVVPGILAWPLYFGLFVLAGPLTPLIAIPLGIFGIYRLLADFGLIGTVALGGALTLGPLLLGAGFLVFGLVFVAIAYIIARAVLFG